MPHMRTLDWWCQAANLLSLNFYAYMGSMRNSTRKRDDRGRLLPGPRSRVPVNVTLPRELVKAYKDELGDLAMSRDLERLIRASLPDRVQQRLKNPA